MKALILLLTVVAALADDQGACGQSCSCQFSGEGQAASLTKQEVLAGTLGTLVPLVTGGLGFGLWRLLRGGGSGGNFSDSGSDVPIAKSRRGSSPPPYDNLSRRRGSTPLSIFEEGERDDFLDSSISRKGSQASFGGPDGSYSSWRRGSVAPSIASNAINIHRPQRDGVNQWLG